MLCMSVLLATPVVTDWNIYYVFNTKTGNTRFFIYTHITHPKAFPDHWQQYKKILYFKCHMQWMLCMSVLLATPVVTDWNICYIFNAKTGNTRFFVYTHITHSKNFSDHWQPVSYTHLDVYKRQPGIVSI